MQRAEKFLKEAGTYFLATVEGDQPRVRPFGTANIFDGKPYKKETLMMSALVTRDNANVLLMESEEIMRKANQLNELHSKANSYLRELDTQRMVNWLAVGLICLLLVTLVLLYLYHLRKTAFQRERVLNTLWNMDTHPTQGPQSQLLKQDPLPVAEEGDSAQYEKAAGEATEEASAPLPQTEQQAGDSTSEKKAEESPNENEPADVSFFITRFKEVVEARLTDSEVSVEDLASDMNLSRVQLYRKVKSFTDSSPVEILRTARLSRAYQLLLTTDKSVSEVAYSVGFTSPSYFTKCFKEEYGMVPGDVRK